MNSLKNIWNQFIQFTRFNQSIYVKIVNDRYESANALIVVVFSLLAIYVPFILNVSTANLGDVVFYGIVDGTFAWLFSTLATWFLLSRAFNTIVEVSNILVLTGYTHGVLGGFGLLVLVNIYLDISSLVLQIGTLSILVWMYFLLSKSLTASLLIEKRSANIASATNLVVLIFFSDHGTGIGERFGERNYGVYLYEETIRTFYLFIGPNMIQNKIFENLKLNLNI